MIDRRIEELREWEAETGQPLPLPPETIIALEDDDLIVDLETGEVLVDRENQGIKPW